MARLAGFRAPPRNEAAGILRAALKRRAPAAWRFHAERIVAGNPFVSPVAKLNLDMSLLI